MGVGFEINARLELEDLQKILDKRGLQPGGRVQTVVDEAVLRYCNPKVPMETGMLIKSGVTASVVGKGLLVYSAPYARYLYYGEIYGPNIPIYEGGELAGWRSPKGKKKRPTGRKLTYQGAPERGALWFERAMAEHKDDVVREAAFAAGGRAK